MASKSPTELITPELGTGERLLWAGQPRQGLFLRPSDWVQIPFSLCWGGFAFFWEWSLLHSKAPPEFGLFGVPFVAIGAYLIVGRFFVDAAQRARTTYALTSERAVIISGFTRATTKSLQLRTLSNVTLVESGDGSGTITFGAPAPWWATGGGIPNGRAQFSPAFDSIPDVRDVYERLRRAQQPL